MISICTKCMPVSRCHETVCEAIPKTYQPNSDRIGQSIPEVKCPATAAAVSTKLPGQEVLQKRTAGIQKSAVGDHSGFQTVRRSNPKQINCSLSKHSATQLETSGSRGKAVCSPTIRRCPRCRYRHSGHWHRNLCSVWRTLVMLTHLIDQVQERCCRVFEAASQARVSRIQLWAEIRAGLIAVNLKGWDGLMLWLTPEAPPGPPPEGTWHIPRFHRKGRPGGGTGVSCARKIGKSGTETPCRTRIRPRSPAPNRRHFAMRRARNRLRQPKRIPERSTGNCRLDRNRTCETCRIGTRRQGWQIGSASKKEATPLH